MNKNILLSVFCLLFLTCEVPLERVNPLDGLQIVCLSVFETGNNQARVESQIQTNEKVGVIDYGHCVEQVDEIEDLAEFSIDTWDECSSKGELVTEEGAISFEDNFEIFTDLPYQFFTYATVSVMGKEMTIYSDVIKFEIDAKYICVNNDCVEDPTGPHDTYTDCLIDCGDTRYSCDNNDCIVNPNGLYVSSDCNGDCVPDIWRCNGNYCVDCNEDDCSDFLQEQTYDNYTDCNNNCDNDELYWICENNECKNIFPSTGDYIDREQCQDLAQCGKFSCDNGDCIEVEPETGEFNDTLSCQSSGCELLWKCLDGDCQQNTNGTFDTYNLCVNSCIDELGWGCSNGECVQMEGGDSPTRYDCIIACGYQRYICVDSDGDGFGDDCEPCVTIDEEIGFANSAMCNIYCNGTSSSIQYLGQDCVEVDD